MYARTQTVLMYVPGTFQKCNALEVAIVRGHDAIAVSLLDNLCQHVNFAVAALELAQGGKVRCSRNCEL